MSLTNEEKLELAKKRGASIEVGVIAFYPEEFLAYTSAIEEKYQAQIAEIQTAWHINMLRLYPEKSHEEIAKAIEVVSGKSALDAFIAEVKAEVWKEAEKICLRLQNEAENLRFKQNRDSQRFAYGEAAAEFSERAAKLHNQSQAEMDDCKRPTAQIGGCRKCGGRMISGKALVDIYSGRPDFPGDTKGITMSPSGKAVLVNCMKCEQCGWSVNEESH